MRDLCHRGCQHVARTAPIGPKIYHYWLRVAGAQHLCFKIAIGYGLNVISHVVCPQRIGLEGLRYLSLSSLIRCRNEDLVSCQTRRLVKLRIFRCGTLPRKVLGHTVYLDTFPEALIGEMMQSQANSF